MPQREVPASGPAHARVMIVGEAPGVQEEASGEPFVGPSGWELNKMLGEAGISRAECYVTNVCRVRPPANDINLYFAQSKKEVTKGIHFPLRDKQVTKEIIDGYSRLRLEIDSVKPKVIIALGNTPLWALTGKWGVTKWRGSTLVEDLSAQATITIPTYHPAAILRQWSWRGVGVHDLRRARVYRDGAGPPTPKYNFILRPSYDQALNTLQFLMEGLDRGTISRISFDIETRAGHIACAGLSWSDRDAICIPLMCVERREGFWSLGEEAELVCRISQILTHPRVEVVGQNLLYDSQYTWRHWRFVPRVTMDTMIAQHACFSDMPKALAFLASMYCDYYVYWKDEGKSWDPKVGEDQLWHYNCLDCVYTYEVAESLAKTIAKLGLSEVNAAQQAMFWPVLRAMQVGVRIDQARRGQLTMEVMEEVAKREAFLAEILGHPLNPNSTPQMQKLFYEDLRLPVQMTRATKGKPSRPTLNDDALQKLSLKEPLVKPIINCIADMRTMGVFLSNFLTRPLDRDQRMRCAYNIGGSESGASAPKTYRLSSSENAFGSGGNLQNIPSEKSKSLGKAAARGATAGLGDAYQLPNIRSMFVPDSGYTWISLDLDRADLQVVVYESDDPMLKAALRLGADIHLMNAFVLDGKDPPPLEELVESHPRYGDHRGPRKLKREFAKVFCHGTNYGGKAPTMASHTGWSIRETERAQALWFGAHPNILKWHDRVKTQVTTRRFVENRFGYRWYIFDRPDSIIPEAIAWIPQSTVSIVINRIWQALFALVPDFEILLQTHDSLDGQVQTAKVEATLTRIAECAKIVIPYDDPLVIPFKVGTSTKSWGDCA